MATLERLGVGGLTIVIQAGGSSTRIGRDKGLIQFQGLPLVEYVLRQVDGLGDDRILISNQPEKYRQFGLPVYEDVLPGTGSLGGLYSAIYYAPQDYCLVLACDMPFVNRPLLEHMIGISTGFDAVVPNLGEGSYFEPFRAIYRKTCLHAIRNALDAGKRRMICFFDDVDVCVLEPEEIKRFDYDARSFFNINTQEDLEQAETLARQK